MTVFALKLIALASMIVDHTGYFLGSNALVSGDVYTLLRAVGRIAFPVYAFLLVNGFQKTSDRRRYLSRLMLFAVLSQIPFTLVFASENYRSVVPSVFGLSFGFELLPYLIFILLTLAAYILLVKADISALYLALFLLVGGVQLQLFGYWFLDGSLNIFYTLSFSLAAMALLDDIVYSGKPLIKTLVPALFFTLALVLLVPNSDYGYKGFALLMALYLCRPWRGAQLAVIALWCYMEYWSPGSPQVFLLSLLSLPPILLYNGKKGPSMKLAFYAVYPLHLLALGVINMLI